MAVTSWTAPGTVVSARYTSNSANAADPIAWTNPSNATSNNGSEATATATTASTEFLKATNYGFSIPSTAQIDGIEMRFERQTQSNGGTTTDHHVVLCLNGDPGGSNRRKTANWPTTATLSAIYGTPYDTWGIMLTPGDVNDSDFGVCISAIPTATKTVGVDYIEMRVHYTDNTNYTIVEASPGTVASDNGVGTVAWTNPSNVGSDNNTRASGSFDSSADLSQYLKCTNYGFSIPSGQEILAIQVIVTGRVTTAATTGGDILDNRVRLVKAGTIQATDKAITTTGSYGMWYEGASGAGDQARCYGDTILDLWSGSWTHTDINDSTFGVAVAVKGTSATNLTAEIDNVRIRVKYQPDVGTITGLDDIWGCLHWYRGDDVTTGSGRVTQLNDKTGNGYHAVESSASGGTLSSTLGVNSNETGIVFNDDYYDIPVNIGQNGSIVAYASNTSNPVTGRVDWMYNSQEPDGSGFGASFWTLNDFVVAGQRQVEWGSSGGTITSFRNNTTSLNLALNEYAGMCWLFDRTTVYNGSGTTSACIGSRLHDRSLAARMNLLEHAAYTKILSPGERAAIQAYFVTSWETSNTHHGVATVSGTGALSGSGHVTRYGSITLSGAGVIAGTPKLLKKATAALSGLGTLSANGRLTYHGMAPLAGAGTLSGAAQITRHAIASMSGFGVLSAIPKVIYHGVVLESGTSTLTANGHLIYHGVANLSGLGALSANATKFVKSTAMVTGTGTLSAVGHRIVHGVSSLSGPGTLSAVGQITAHGIVSLSGSGTLAATANRILHATSTISGAGILSASATSTLSGIVTLTGVGTLSAVPTHILHGVATITGTSTLSSSAAIALSGVASLSGTSDLTAQTTGLIKGAVTLSGLGTLSGDGHRIVHGVSTISGAGALSGAGRKTLHGASTLLGVGTLSASYTYFLHGTVGYTGSGTLACVPHLFVSGQANISGAGTLSALSGIHLSASATLTGTGTLVPTAQGIIKGSASLTGIGTLPASAGLQLKGQTTLAGVGALTAIGIKKVGGASVLAGSGQLVAYGVVGLGGSVSLTATGTLVATASLSGTGADIRNTFVYLIPRRAPYATIVKKSVVLDRVRRVQWQE